MKLYKLSLALFLGLGAMATTSCEDKLDVTNPNQQTTVPSVSMLMMRKSALLQHTTIFVWKVLRHVWVTPSMQFVAMKYGTHHRYGTSHSMTWTTLWQTKSPCGLGVKLIILLMYVTSSFHVLQVMMLRSAKAWSESRVALFLRGYSYYTLAGYYQNPALITDYANYSTLDGLYGKNSTYDEVLDQVEKDFSEAMTLLPSRDEGGEWSRAVLPAVLLRLLCPHSDAAPQV